MCAAWCSGCTLDEYEMTPTYPMEIGKKRCNGSRMEWKNCQMAREIRDEKFHFHLELVVKKIYIPSVADLHLCRVPIEPKYVSCVAFALIAAAAAAVAIHSVVPAAFISSTITFCHTHTRSITLLLVMCPLHFYWFLCSVFFRIYFCWCVLLSSCLMRAPSRR